MEKFVWRCVTSSDDAIGGRAQAIDAARSWRFGGVGRRPIKIDAMAIFQPSGDLGLGVVIKLQGAAGIARIGLPKLVKIAPRNRLLASFARPSVCQLQQLEPAIGKRRRRRPVVLQIASHFGGARLAATPALLQRWVWAGSREPRKSPRIRLMALATWRSTFFTGECL